MKINAADIPRILLAIAVRRMPDERDEWGEAMLAELAQLRNPFIRWRFALGCARVALFPPLKGGLLQSIMKQKMESLIAALGAAALISVLLALPLERGGAWLAWAYTIYGLVFLLIPAVLFADFLLLGVVVWAVAGHARGRRPWPNAPAYLRRSVRLGVEVVFGLLNPALYLAIFTTALPLNPPGREWWLAPLTLSAWILLLSFWTMRICGGAFDPRSRGLRIGARALLLASLAWLLGYIVKDAWLLVETTWSRTSTLTFSAHGPEAVPSLSHSSCSFVGLPSFDINSDVPGG